ncbi:hypothetical protein [Microbulbifer rhizosphaerae]|uniref:Uncharacterized protein n=1 Tax=Microbulbifer rhizosphaerae TaxID=1562603 RepID=A0A7W4Z8C5_9GAMM|nr:hypothetical protein [Microbulbifer rhizosphaerae]MBB3060416.1 hypothetical protein [Microbulbifer rhizosphaerae]
MSVINTHTYCGHDSPLRCGTFMRPADNGMSVTEFVGTGIGGGTQMLRQASGLMGFIPQLFFLVISLADNR